MQLWWLVSESWLGGEKSLHLSLYHENNHRNFWPWSATAEGTCGFSKSKPTKKTWDDLHGHPNCWSASFCQMFDWYATTEPPSGSPEAQMSYKITVLVKGPIQKISHHTLFSSMHNRQLWHRGLLRLSVNSQHSVTRGHRSVGERDGTGTHGFGGLFLAFLALLLFSLNLALSHLFLRLAPARQLLEEVEDEQVQQLTHRQHAPA